MTWEQLITAGGFVIGLFVAVFGVWKYIDSKISSVRTDVAQAEKALAEHRTHVAETYVTKTGMHEQTSQIMNAINGVASRIDGLYELFGHSRSRSTRDDR